MSTGSALQQRNGSASIASGSAMTANSAKPAVLTTFNVKSNDDSSQLLTITNTITEVSPTGYVTRFAPYALILVGGILLLIIAKKHKKTTDED